jgi:hypothetical protein
MYDLTWVAQFNDGSMLEQYKLENEEWKEIRFKEVLENQDKLVTFSLVDRHNKLVYLLNLQNGNISFGKFLTDLIPPREDMFHKENYRYRLIYFREVERTFGASLQEIGIPKVLYFLGCQYTDNEGKNHKRLMRISSNGNWVSN